MVKLLLSALAIVAPFTPLQQVYDDFTTFETASYFNHAFDDLTGYELGYSELDYGRFRADYTDEDFIYYALPVYYDVSFGDYELDLYYTNDYFNFYLNDGNDGLEAGVYLDINNYIGSEELYYFARLDTNAMATYIDNEKGKEVVSDIIGTITSMVTGLLGGLGTGISGMFSSLFLDGSNISSLGIWIIVLLGLSIALGAVAWVSTLIRGKQR